MSKKKKQSSEADDQPADRDEQQPEAPADAEAAAEPQDLQAERDDLLARLQRVSADYMNYQKRVQREHDEHLSFARADLIKALLPVLDDMERALEVARENHGEDDAFFKGMQLVHDKMLEVLRRFGCTVIPADGMPFDPDKHSAMMQQPSDEHEPQTIIRELQKGYLFNGRTLRPSGVIVAVAPENATPPDDTESSANGES